MVYKINQFRFVLTTNDMRHFYILVILMLLARFVSAQTGLSGTVTDAKSRPITGATISLKDTYDGATTDSSGRFSFQTTEKGEQTLLVSAIG